MDALNFHGTAADVRCTRCVLCAVLSIVSIMLLTGSGVSVAPAQTHPIPTTKSRDGGACILDTPNAAGVSRPETTINTIVLHHTALDSVGGSLAMLRQRGLSYHYLIDPAGKIIRLVPPHRIALHAAGANRRSIGISFVGGPSFHWSPTTAQRSAVKQLVGALTRSYSTIRYVIGHGDVRETNRGEPYGITMTQLLHEISAEQHINLRHPRPDEQPLRAFRDSAIRLEIRPLTPRRRVPFAQLPKIETATCTNGEQLSYPVP
jgi:hypothetical protein